MAESGEGEKKEAGLLIVQSKVREAIRAKEKRVSDEFINALSEHVHQTIDKAAITVSMLGPSTAVTRIANTTSGKAKMMSTSRLTAESTQPPR